MARRIEADGMHGRILGGQREVDRVVRLGEMIQRLVIGDWLVLKRQGQNVGR